jgi:hypothetical protein
MSNGKGIWFVYRSHYEGALGKRVRRIEAPSILAWFQEKIADARGSKAPRDVADADLGGHVYGFDSLLAAAKEHKLAAPKSTSALRAMLHKHLYVERGPENIRVDDHSVRVCTDDDEVSLAYYFFDDDAVREHPDETAWLLEEDPLLFDDGEDGGFAPPERARIRALEPTGAGVGETYACLFTFYDGDTLPGQASVFRGVRLPELAAHLRSVAPASRPSGASPDILGAWPIELRALRGLLRPEDRSLEGVLARCAAYPFDAVVRRLGSTELGVGTYEDARGEIAAAAEGKAHRGDPSRSIVHAGEHVAVLCAHTSKAFGFQQWVLFDDRWAAANPDLAGSLLLYASDWDPFPWSDDGPRSLAVLLDEPPPLSQQRAWAGAMEGHGPDNARRYKPSERFASGELIDHAKFGIGLVRRVEPTKIEVVFRDATRTLAHGAG